MSKTLFIVNPHAGNGRGAKSWAELERNIQSLVEDYVVVMTFQREDVATCLAEKMDDNIDRVISVGGDGTSNVILNALMQYKEAHPDNPFVYGVIPAGTGDDFARGAGLPKKTLEAGHYVLNQATVQPVDVGFVECGDERRYFLNIASAGISNNVVQRLERFPKRPWTYLASVLASLMSYEPEAVRIELDGAVWYEGRIYIAAIANGTTFAQGIQAAPDAQVSDGLFDVVIAEETSKPDLIRILAQSYRGTHIHHAKVSVGQAKHVRITSATSQLIGMDTDGEPAAGGSEIHYTIQPGALPMLL